MEELRINLQLFAEGAGAAAAAPGAGNGPVAGDAGDKGQATDGQAAADQGESREETYRKMMRGEYKDLYSADVERIVKDRLKASKAKTDAYDALTPTIELLSRKYGVDATDVKALNKAIEDDDSYYEDEALEKGVTVEQLKQIRKIERENAELKAQMREKEVKENADRIYAGWMTQAEEAKRTYPNLDLKAELADNRFVSLLRAGVDVGTAYQVVHKDELIPAAMQYAQREGEKKVAASVAANARRPAESAGSPTAGTPTPGVEFTTKAQRDEIARRVANGERIVL